VGAVSYYLIERPALRHWRGAAAARVNAAALATIAALVLLALAVAVNAERIHPVAPHVSAIAAYAGYERSAAGVAQFRRGICFATDDAPEFGAARCLARRRGRRALLVLGDSYAAQYNQAIAQHFAHADVLQATAAGCRPLIDAQGARRCTALMRRAFADLIATRRVDALVLAGRWLAKEDESLARTIAFVRAHNVAVTVIGPAVEYDGNVPLVLARGIERGDARALDRFRLNGTAREQAVRALAVRAGAGYHSIAARVCPQRHCFVYAAPGVPVQFDSGHVTHAAATYLMRDLAWPR
jgi:hypothetical protein